MINNHAAPEITKSYMDFAAFFGKIERQFNVILKEGDIEIVFDCIAENAYTAKVMASTAYPGCRVVAVGIYNIH